MKSSFECSFAFSAAEVEGKGHIAEEFEPGEGLEVVIFELLDRTDDEAHDFTAGDAAGGGKGGVMGALLIVVGAG